MNRFYGLDGWPCSFEETETARALVKALKALPGNSLADDAAMRVATLIYNVADGARDLEIPRNLSASPLTSENELRKLHKLSSALADHVQKMHQPAIAGLFAEGYNPFTVAASAEELAQGAREAMDYADAAPGARGRRKKLAASDITDFLASVYLDQTGRPPTLTTGLGRGHTVSGPWFDFLCAVLPALGIDASPESQARALMEKKARKPGL